jgi:hypothetical protein
MHRKILFLLLLCPLNLLLAQAYNKHNKSGLESIAERIAKDEDFIDMKKSQNAITHYIIIGEIARDGKEHERSDEAFISAMKQSEEAFVAYLYSIGWQTGTKEYARLLMAQTKHLQAFTVKFAQDLKDLSKDEISQTLKRAEALANLNFNTSQSLKEFIDKKYNRNK